MTLNLKWSFGDEFIFTPESIIDVDFFTRGHLKSENNIVAM